MGNHTRGLIKVQTQIISPSSVHCMTVQDTSDTNPGNQPPRSSNCPHWHFITEKLFNLCQVMDALIKTSCPDCHGVLRKGHRNQALHIQRSQVVDNIWWAFFWKCLEKTLVQGHKANHKLSGTETTAERGQMLQVLQLIY